MPTIVGSNTEELLLASRNCASVADRLSGVTTTINSSLDTTSWKGPNATQFRTSWAEEGSLQVQQAALHVRQLAAKLVTEANQQTDASKAGSSPPSKFGPLLPGVAGVGYAGGSGGRVPVGAPPVTGVGSPSSSPPTTAPRLTTPPTTKAPATTSPTTTKATPKPTTPPTTSPPTTSPKPANVPVTGNGNATGLDPGFASNLTAFTDAATKAGYRIQVFSGYRSQAKQDALFAAAVKKYGSEKAARKWVAKSSNHTRGIACDLYINGQRMDLNATGKVGEGTKWAHDNAQKFGLHFPMSWENWHIEPSSTPDKG
jgi:D-alanyl-D-alanine carboxypeptidase